MTVDPVVLDRAGRPVLHLGTKEVDLEPRGRVTIQMGAEWPQPRLWMPDDPHLYVLETRLIRDGKRVDAHRERFGFRESWIERGEFMFNGRIMHYHQQSDYLNPQVLTGDRAFLRMHFRLHKALGHNLMRTFRKPTPVYLEIADEEGMLVKPQSGWHHPDNPLTEEFKRNALPVLRQWLVRDRNHPCIAMWCAENEGYSHIESIKWAVEQMALLDPTRPIDADSSHYTSLYAADGTLKRVDWAGVANAHYPLTAGLGSYSVLTGAAYPFRWARRKAKPVFFGEWGDHGAPGWQTRGAHELEAVFELTHRVGHGNPKTNEGTVSYLESILPHWRRCGGGATGSRCAVPV